ncbi:MAG: hypothetical protein V2J02_08060 [Pseudomonadales bacterium]|jgi:hypothetical protein|nr:hypothetical protein [Pseudomonadales bacterium]
MGFTAALTNEQVETLDASITGIGTGVGPWRRALLGVLSRDEADLVQAARDDEVAEAFLAVLEAAPDAIEKHRATAELLEAAQARLMLVLETVYSES